MTDVDTERSKNLAGSKKIRDQLDEFYGNIEKGFEDQASRTRSIGEYWDIYNCILGSKQNYDGDNRMFIPSVFQAIQARVTRFTNQLFPFSGMHVEAISTDAQSPRARTALAEHYIRTSGLKQEVEKLVVNTDVEGHGWIYTAWSERKRYVVERIKKNISLDTGPVGDVSDLKDSVVEDNGPDVEILSDSDVLVLPATSKSLYSALEEGGCICILRRWSKEKLKSLIAAGHISSKEGNELIGLMQKDPQGSSYYKDRTKQALHSAGIKGTGRGKYALVFEVWALLDLPEGRRLCQIFFGAPKIVLHAHRNPLWCDCLPLIGTPAIKITGSHKGRSMVSSVDTLQYFINDVANMGGDSAVRSLVAMVMTDPNANPHYDTMKQAQGAVWLCDPRVTQIIKYPELWKDAGGIINMVDGMIKTTLSVNPAMMTQYARPTKPSQGQVAQEQAVELLSTAYNVGDLENSLSEWLRLVMEMDKQYRDESITVQSFGELGMQALMEEIPPQLENKRHSFVWYGVEQIRSEQRLQTLMGLINVTRNMPPQSYQGYKLDISPALVRAFDSAAGPRVGRQIFQDIRSQLSMNPELENELMDKSHDIAVHPLDDHQMHMQSHLQSMQEVGDVTGRKAAHLFKHTVAAASAMQAQTEAAQPQQTPGPRLGARPARGGGRPVQRPPGSLHKDQLAASGGMPRPVRGRTM